MVGERKEGKEKKHGRKKKKKSGVGCSLIQFSAGACNACRSWIIHYRVYRVWYLGIASSQDRMIGPRREKTLSKVHVRQ